MNGRTATPPHHPAVRSPRPGIRSRARFPRRTARAAAAGVLVALAACGGNGPATPSGPSGASGASHNAGRNCLECHGFTAAGTVYAADGVTPVSGAVVRLSSGPSGQGTVATLTSDASGNFYTSQPLNLASGLYTDVARPGGTPRAMSSPITSGGCNAGGCHAAGNRIRVD